jgi:hypothetical protein
MHEKFFGCGHNPIIRTSSNQHEREVWRHTRHVRFGSKADIKARPFDVRFTLESGHRLRQSGCLLWAKRWGNRPALLWIAEDLWCCASG